MRVQEPYVVASWPSVPVEIVRAAGFRAVMARGASDPTPAADAHLEPGIFPNRLRHLVEDALTGRLSHAARIVIPRTSDADYKCFLYLREFVRRGVATALAPIVLFDLLQSRGADVRNHDVARTRALLDELASGSGRMPSADDLRREITRANAARAAARRLVGLRRTVPRVDGNRRLPIARGILGDGTGSLRGDGKRSCEQDRGAPTARRPTRAAHWSACGWPGAARGHRIARCRRRCRSRPVGKRRRGRRRTHRRRPGCRARRQVSSRLDRRAYTRGLAAPLDAEHARRRRCRRRVAAPGRCGVRLGLSVATRRAEGASHSTRLSSRRPV